MATWPLIISGTALRARATLIALVVLGASDAKAQRSIGVGIGADIPIGESADILKSGYHSMVSLSVTPRKLHRAIRIDGAITELRARDSASTAHRIKFVAAAIVLAGPSRLTPSGYVIAGFGSYQQQSGGARRTDNGVNIGAGINFPRRVVGTFVEARLHYIGGKTRTKFFPMTGRPTFAPPSSRKFCKLAIISFYY